MAAAAAGSNLVGMGKQSAVVRYDIPAPPQESGAPGEFIDWMIRELGGGDPAPGPEDR